MVLEEKQRKCGGGSGSEAIDMWWWWQVSVYKYETFKFLFQFEISFQVDDMSWTCSTQKIKIVCKDI